MLTNEIAQFLHDNGFGVFDSVGVNGTIFIEYSPESPDDCITIYKNSGQSPTPNNVFKTPAIQLIVRGVNVTETEMLAEKITDSLNGYNSKPLIPGGKRIYNVQALQSPYNLGKDKNNRYEFTVNFLIEYDNRN